MKKCAKCDFEYEDVYDGCPRCARTQSDPTSDSAPSASVPSGSSNRTFVVVLLTVLAVFLVCGLALSSCMSSCTPAPENTALEAKVRVAIVSGPYDTDLSDVKKVYADKNGLVTVTLNETASELESESNPGVAYIGAVLLHVPEVQRVTVEGSDGAIVNSEDRSK